MARLQPEPIDVANSSLGGPIHCIFCCVFLRYKMFVLGLFSINKRFFIMVIGGFSL